MLIRLAAKNVRFVEAGALQHYKVEQIVILHEPFKISARLCPALQINDTWLSWNGGEFILDFQDGTTYIIDDFHGGMGGLQGYFEAILSFMGAAAESRQYRERTGMEGENEDLFPPHIVDWIVDNLDEIECLQFDLNENLGLIES